MENLLKEESPPASPQKVKVIVVKLPFDLQERFASFPLLHALRSYYPKAEIHLITPKKKIEILNLLPFTAYYHEFDEDEIKSIFDVHRYCANAKIYQVDLFISLTDSFADACLGISLRAKERLGFSDGWKTLVLNQKTPRPRGNHLSEDFLELFKVHTGETIDPKTKIISRDLPAVIKDYDTDPYIAINLSPLRGSFIEDEWRKLSAMYEKQKIIFFASEDQEKITLLAENFLSSLPAQNDYIFFKYPGWIELAKMLAYARGVITYNGAAASLSAYVGTKTLIMFDQEDPKRYAPFYFNSEINLMTGSDPAVTQTLTHTQGGVKPRIIFSMVEVFKRSMGFFDL